MRTVVRELILDEHLPYWINAAEQGYSEAVIGDEWLPFMFAHTARTLIRYYEDDFDHSMNEEILQSLDTLARLTWDVAYREKDALFGLFYRADGTGDESPAPDLSLFTMPWYAWLYRETGDAWFKERAIILLESGLNWAWLTGVKQFDQSFIWSSEGVGDLGWSPNGP